MREETPDARGDLRVYAVAERLIVCHRFLADISLSRALIAQVTVPRIDNGIATMTPHTGAHTRRARYYAP